MTFISTKPGAMFVPQCLGATNQDLIAVQNRINVGFKFAAAKDNGGIFVIPQNMRTEIGGLRAINQSVGLAQSVNITDLAAGATNSALPI